LLIDHLDCTTELIILNLVKTVKSAENRSVNKMESSIN